MPGNYKQWQQQYKGTPYRGYYWKRYNKASGITQRLVKDIGSIKKQLNVEHHFKDIAINATPTPAGQSYFLNGLAIGDDESERTGRQVKFESVYIRLWSQIHPSAFGTFVRVVLIIDQQPQAGAFGPGNFLQSPGVYPWLSPLRADNGHRYRVLYDEEITLDPNGHNTQYTSTFKELELKSRYDGTTAVQADISSNAIYLVIISNEPTNLPAVQGFARVRYVDN